MSVDSERWILYPGILLLAVGIIVALGFPVSWPDGYRHQPFVRPMLVLELPQDADEFQTLTASAQDDVRRAQYADFVFICFYGLFFLSFSVAVEDERTASTIVIFTLVTMVLDVGENVFILEAVGDAAAGTLRTVLIFGCAKWVSFFTIALAMAEALFASGGFWRFAGFIMRIAALVGMFAAAASFLSSSARPLVVASSLEAALTMFVIIAATALNAIVKHVAAKHAAAASA